MAVGNRPGDDTTWLACDEPGETPPELTGGQPPPLPADERDAIAAAVLAAEVVDPLGEDCQIVVGRPGALRPGGMRAPVAS